MQARGEEDKKNMEFIRRLKQGGEAGGICEGEGNAKEF